MNYRHAFHAGNFADVMKHVALTRVIEHLKSKDKPFRFIDTHAGTGLYDVSADEAQRSGEWQNGIGALLRGDCIAPIGVETGSDLDRLLLPFFDVLRAVNGATAQRGNSDDRRDDGAVADGCQASDTSGDGSARGHAKPFRFYPGAGEFARRLMRPDDRLVLNELHEADAQSLRRLMLRDERVRTMSIDGWSAVKSLLPPVERRGVMLIDPPFEVAGEFKRLEDALAAATSRFASGVTLLWYPIKAGGAAAAFVNRMEKSGHSRLLMAELLVRHPDALKGLNGAGLIIHNPPYRLDAQLNEVLFWLHKHLGQRPGSSI